MTYRLAIRATFAAAHRIEGARGRCEKLHGHNFGVELAVSGEGLDDSGMLVDFGLLKGVLREVLADLDHTDLSAHPAFAGASPSSEAIARHICGEAAARLKGCGASVTSVTVSESDDASATYFPQGAADTK